MSLRGGFPPLIVTLRRPILPTMTGETAEQSPYWHIHVRPRSPRLDAHGREVLADVRQIGLKHVEAVASSKIYLLAGHLTADDVRLIAEELVTDSIAEACEFGPGLAPRRGDAPAVEVHRLPGVMNPAAMSTQEAAGRLLEARGDGTIDQIQTGRRYEFTGVRSADELDELAGEVLANDCIERWFVSGLGRNDPLPETFPSPPSAPFKLKHVAMRDLNDKQLKRLSREGHLFLSLEEMRTIRDHFAKLGRDPTDLEVETLAQTWSEHCVHKTLKAAIDYHGADFGRPGQVDVHFDNLLKETIVHATATLDREWCLSVFVDNAGVIAFDDEYGLAFKVETHNHPSAIEPYGGAATGIGGCIRDVMGCGLGAKPIASTDVFCLAYPTFEARRVPQGVLHPRRVLKGVVGGVRDYGNRMGIPTVNGAIHFDDRYLGNPLVFCGCVGLIPRDKIAKAPRAGDFIVVAGGRTGRDGIHGATFSSAELTDQHADEFSHAVQIGNAIEEKKVLDALLLARDHASGCLYSSVTDCGAGGLSSAVGEMGEELGAAVDLEKVPLKYSGLRYDEIWISEAQERMVFAVGPDRLDEFLAIFAGEEVEATAIGRFTGDHFLRVRFEGTLVGELDMSFLHDGLPRTRRRATWNAPDVGEASTKESGAAEGSNNDRLLAALSDPNVASKEWVIRQYDHEVQGRSVIKPLVGPGFGPSDAAVVRPRYDKPGGVALACGLCNEWADVDPYTMAICAVDEALRNVICVGADPARTAILDNFCWPRCDSQESLGALVRTCRGACDAAIAFGLPFISGKDSLNNEFSMSAAEAKRTGLPERIVIPYTLLISAIGLVDDVGRCVSMDLKRPDDVLVFASAPVDRVGLSEAFEMHTRVSELIRSGKVSAAHDVSDGGLAVAIAEMCIASGLGASIDSVPADVGDTLLTNMATSYVLAMSRAAAVECGLPILGKVTADARLRIDVTDGDPIDLLVERLATAWRAPLAQGGGT